MTLPEFIKLDWDKFGDFDIGIPKIFPAFIRAITNMDLIVSKPQEKIIFDQKSLPTYSLSISFNEFETFVDKLKLNTDILQEFESVAWLEKRFNYRK